MAEELINEKVVDVKGISTVTGEEEVKTDPIEIEPVDPIDPIEPVEEDSPVEDKTQGKDRVIRGVEFKDPTTKGEAFLRQVSGVPTRSVEGSVGYLDTKLLEEAYAPVNISDGIPDAAEREKFKYYNDDKLVKLVDENTFGITFENDLVDVYKFKQRQYPFAVKKFIDDLDSNQGWVTELSLSLAKLLGKTTLAVGGGLVGSAYSAVSSLYHLDIDRFNDNAFWDMTDSIDESLNTHLAIYGGSDVWDLKFNPKTNQHEFKQKEFLARFGNDPLKSFNMDVVDAASFVMGAVITETLAAGITGLTGGLAAPTLIANTARLGAQAARLWNKSSKIGKTARLMRGLDRTAEQAIQQGTRLNRALNTYRKGMGTITTAYRSSAYESALIARDTKEQTLNNLLREHHLKAGGTITEEGIILDENGKELRDFISPDAKQFRTYERAAQDAANMAFGMNIPLVAGSQFVQLPGIFRKNFKIGNTAKTGFTGRLANSWKRMGLTGSRFKGGKWIPNADVNKYLTALGYTGRFISRPAVEAFEELSQGGIQEGLADYYSINYTPESARTMGGMMNAIVDQTVAFAGTAEGRDSMTIGGLMGLLGVPGPKRKASGKLGIGWFGGSVQATRELKKQIEKSREIADRLNNDKDLQLNPVLAHNFESTVRHMNLQERMEDALERGDINEFKNTEFDQLFNFVYNRVNMGVGDSIGQELEALKNIPLEQFNAQFAIKGVQEFTEESRKEALEKAEVRVNNILESINNVETVIAGQKPDLLSKAYSALTGKKSLLEKMNPNIEAALLDLGLREQMAYLHATTKNNTEREAALEKEIRDITERSFNTAAMDRVAAQIIGLRTKKPTVTKQEYKDFVDNGTVSNARVNAIANKIKENIALTKQEEAMRQASKKEVEELLAEEGPTGTQFEVDFKDRSNEILNEILNEWKEENLTNYNLNENKVKPLLKDILALKVRKAQAAEFYKELITKDGSEQFVNFAHFLKEQRDKEINKILRKEVEEKIKDKKGNNLNLRNKKKQADSIGVDPKVYNDRIDEDSIAGIQEIEKINNNKSLSFKERLEEKFKVLDKYPGLLTNLVDKVEDELGSIGNVSTAQEILNTLNALELQNIDVYNKYVNTIENQLNTIAEEVEQLIEKSRQQNDQVTGRNNQNQANDESGRAPSKDEIQKAIEQGRFDYKKGVQVTDYYTIMPTFFYDVKGGVKLDEEGNIKPHPKLRDRRYNRALVDNPKFNPDQLIVRVRPNEFDETGYDDTVEGQSTNTMSMDVLALDPKTGEEIFVTYLPIYKEGDPIHLKNLRQAVRKRHDLGQNSTLENNRDRISEIRKEIEDIKEKLQENLDAKKEETIDQLVPELKGAEELTNKEDVGALEKAVLIDETIEEGQPGYDGSTNVGVELTKREEREKTLIEGTEAYKAAEELVKSDPKRYRLNRKGSIYKYDTSSIRTITVKGKSYKVNIYEFEDGRVLYKINLLNEQGIPVKEVKATDIFTKAPVADTQESDWLGSEIVTYKGIKYSVNFEVGEEGAGTITNLKTNKVLKAGITSPKGKAIVDLALKQLYEKESKAETTQPTAEVEAKKADISIRKEESSKILNEYTNREIGRIIRNSNNEAEDSLGKLISKEEKNVSGGKAEQETYEYGIIQRIFANDGSNIQRLTDLNGKVYGIPIINLAMNAKEVGLLFDGKKDFSLSDKQITDFFSSKFKTAIQPIAEVTETIAEVKEVNIEEEIKLEKQLADLNEELKNLAGPIVVDKSFKSERNNIFKKINSFETKSEKDQEEEKEKFEKDLGIENIQRAKVIEKDFNKIIERLKNSQIDFKKECS